MSKETIEFTIPVDEDGFVTLKCPFCAKHFKITGTDANDQDIYEMFCPYCGLVTEPSEFLTDEVKEKALRLALNYRNDILNNFMDDIEKLFKGSDMITFEKGKGFEMNSPKTIIETENMDTYKMSCCDREIKVISIDNELYCPFCGGEIHGDNN